MSLLRFRCEGRTYPNAPGEYTVGSCNGRPAPQALGVAWGVGTGDAAAYNNHMWWMTCNIGGWTGLNNCPPWNAEGILPFDVFCFNLWLGATNQFFLRVYVTKLLVSGLTTINWWDSAKVSCWDWLNAGAIGCTTAGQSGPGTGVLDNTLYVQVGYYYRLPPHACPL